MEQHTPKPNRMGVVAMLLGILAIPTTCCLGFGLPIAAIGMIFALLSRRGKEMTTQATVGFGLCLGCIILSLITTIIATLFTVSNPKFPEMWDTIYHMDLEDFPDYLNDILNDSIENNNGASPDSDTPIVIDPFSNIL